MKSIHGLKAVFINMPIRETAVPNATPQGPLLLATILRDKYFVDTTIIDLNAYRINGQHLNNDEAFCLIRQHFKTCGEPDLVGLSGMITTLRWQESAARIVRELAPDTFLVSGGGLATELKSGLFRYIPELNGVAIGEGDEIIAKIAFDAKIKKRQGTKSIYEGGRPKSLDAVPFADLDLLKEDVFGNKILECYIGNPLWGTSANNSSAASFKMNRSTTFVSSRGCPYSCAFCYRGAQGERNYRMRSAENLAEEFKLHIEKYGVDFIGMPDDNFAINHQRVVDLAPLLKPLNIRWGTHARLDESAEFPLMAEAGCVYIGFGAESASPSVLRAMQKGILNKDIMMEGIRNCENAGIHANCTWIMGFPTETLEDLKASVAFIKWQEEFYVSRGKSAGSVNKKMFTATWYPGTEMGRRPKVRKILHKVFGIGFDRLTGEPVCDENLRRYILELDDATKLLHHPETGEPLNYSEMPTKVFVKARDYIDAGEIYKILEM